MDLLNIEALKGAYSVRIQPFLTVRNFIIATIALALLWFFLGSSSAAAPLTLEIKKKDFVQQVSVAGTVIASDSADLGFSQGGRISHVYASVGDTVIAGSMIAETENGDIRALVSQKQAALDRENAKLASLRAGTRSEDVAVSEASVIAAQSAVAQATTAVINAIQDAYRSSDDAVHGKTDQFISNAKTSFPQLNYLTSDTQLKMNVESKRPEIEKLLESWGEDVQSLSSGSSMVEHASTARTAIATIQRYLSDVSSSLSRGISSNGISNAQLQEWSNLTNTARANVNTSQSAITSALTSYTSAQTSLAREQKALTLKQAPTLPADILAQEASVKAAQADVSSAVAQLAKTQVTAPFTGVITRMEIEKGEIVSANASAITMMSSGRQQIETYISELTIAQITIGQMATVTLDAYGKDVAFAARVILVDPARTIKDGVTTYKTTLEFTESDPRIRSGMTADTVITTAKKTDTIVVPNSAITLKGTERFVTVLEGEEAELRLVRIGGKSLAETEVIEGLRVGEVILLDPK